MKLLPFCFDCGEIANDICRLICLAIQELLRLVGGGELSFLPLTWCRTSRFGEKRLNNRLIGGLLLHFGVYYAKNDSQ